MTHRLVDWPVPLILVTAIVLTLGVEAIPGWIQFTSEAAFASAIAATGVMLLLRAGLLTFGQSLFYFSGAYCAALANRHLGLTDAIVLVFAAAFCGGLLASAIGWFIGRYRGIFFAMLTLALSMVVYGIAVKSRALGGSDGLNIARLTFFGIAPRGPALQSALFLLTVWVCAASAIVTHIILRSRFGKVIEAIEDNEVRLEYLGWSVRHAVYVTYVLSAVLGSVGGALAGLSARHVDPLFAYWTTAGDFVFVALLGGQGSALSPFLGAFVLQTLQTLASTYFPDAWQLALGSVMLCIILFLPAGLGHGVSRLLALIRKKRGGAAAEAVFQPSADR